MRLLDRFIFTLFAAMPFTVLLIDEPPRVGLSAILVACVLAQFIIGAIEYRYYD
jgi:hypothetical protein